MLNLRLSRFSPSELSPINFYDSADGKVNRKSYLEMIQLWGNR
jgi:hypothetical protein